MKDYAFFTVVRHPLERIVSTYRDKIMAWDHYRHWRDIVGYNPAQPFKVSSSVHYSHMPFPTGQQLFSKGPRSAPRGQIDMIHTLKWLLQSFNLLKGFQQFVKILTDTTDLERNTRLAGQRGRANVHLEYFWRRCDLCHIHFDVVAKLETFQLDSQYILQNRLPVSLKCPC